MKCISLLNLSFRSWIVFLSSLSCLSVLSCVLLSFLKVIILNSFSHISWISFLGGLLLENYCAPLEILCFLAFLSFLCLCTDICTSGGAIYLFQFYGVAFLGRTFFFFCVFYTVSWIGCFGFVSAWAQQYSLHMISLAIIDISGIWKCIVA